MTSKIRNKKIQRNKFKSKQAINDCEYCEDCMYMCEGDFACMRYGHPVFVKEDWCPTEYYCDCKACRNYIPKERGK